ncbi:MAG: alpha/beta hydrolase [Methylovirgula sp.]|jgi:pimeloyl-ACP methyl ester carboxylesterase
MTLVLIVALLLLNALVILNFRRDLAAGRKRLAGASGLIDTAAGPIEAAEIGTGFPILFSHGAGGGFDQGLAIGAPIAAAGFRIIAVSRFGYLRSPLPRDCSPQAQADAYAALMEALNIPRAAIIGGSAGAPSAMQFAIRHPDKCAALILIVPIAFHPDDQPSVIPKMSPWEEKLLMVLVGSNLIYWLATKIAPRLIVKLALGTPPRLLRSASDEESARLLRFTTDVLPISERHSGILNDARIAASIPPYDLEKIQAPTLVVSLRDDGYVTFPGAAYSASKIAGAKFIGYESGGHLWVGHQRELMQEIADFLKVPFAARDAPAQQ